MTLCFVFKALTQHLLQTFLIPPFCSISLIKVGDPLPLESPCAAVNPSHAAIVLVPRHVKEVDLIGDLMVCYLNREHPTSKAAGSGDRQLHSEL